MYGLGAVLSHVMDNGSERPVAFASRTLSSSEKNYSQVVKEALALIFVVKKFHLYLCGRSFTILTNQSPFWPFSVPRRNPNTGRSSSAEMGSAPLSVLLFN